MRSQLDHKTRQKWENLHIDYSGKKRCASIPRAHRLQHQGSRRGKIHEFPRLDSNFTAKYTPIRGLKSRIFRLLFRIPGSQTRKGTQHDQETQERRGNTRIARP